MDRRSFLRGVLALPVVAVLAPLLPKTAPSGVLREADLWAAEDSIRAHYALDLVTSRPQLISSATALDEILHASLTLEDRWTAALPVWSLSIVPKDTIYLFDTGRLSL